MLTKNAIRAGCGRGELAYDYVDLGCEEIVRPARPRLQHEKICNGQGTHGVGVPYTVEYPTMAVSNARRERPPLVWVRLADSTEPRGAAAQALLAQPAALVRAALFLRDAHNWRRGGRARALVAAGPPCAAGWCHIASVADPPQGGEQQVRARAGLPCCSDTTRMAA